MLLLASVVLYYDVHSGVRRVLSFPEDSPCTRIYTVDRTTERNF